MLGRRAPVAQIGANTAFHGGDVLFPPRFSSSFFRPFARVVEGGWKDVLYLALSSSQSVGMSGLVGDHRGRSPEAGEGGFIDAVLKRLAVPRELLSLGTECRRVPAWPFRNALRFHLRHLVADEALSVQGAHLSRTQLAYLRCCIHN